MIGIDKGMIEGIGGGEGEVDRHLRNGREIRNKILWKDLRQVDDIPDILMNILMDIFNENE